MKKSYKLTLLSVLVVAAVLVLSGCTFVFTGAGRVFYDDNNATEGTAPVDPTLYAYGDTATVLGNTGNLQKSGCVFVGWNTNADGTGMWYYADDSLKIDSFMVILYAQWMPWYEILGTWSLTYQWHSMLSQGYSHWYIEGSMSDQSDWTFYDDQLASGSWSISGNTIEFHYQNGISYVFSFLGSNYLSSDNRWRSMRGTMSGRDAYGVNHTGTWSATQLSTSIIPMARSVLESGSITPSGEVVK
jgi:hypothetical protein